MDDIGLTSSPKLVKPTCSPLNNNKQRIDSASVIQQADVSSSRPALLAYDALGPLLFEALDGFFFTINHNFEFDFVSDNVGQYLKFSQEQLAGRSLFNFVHPTDVSEFSKAWAKKDTGDSLATLVNNEQSTIQSRGRTFSCRMLSNDDSTPYIRMIITVALHRDSLGSDKTFLICIARRSSLNDSNDKPSLLGFDQFSSRINLNYDIEYLDSSHMKSETVDTNFHGKNFRDYVYSHDIPLIERHFQEVTEKGEGKSSVYRFRLHDHVYAFINTRSKLFHSSATNKSDSILSTHTIVRIIENSHDLAGSAATRLMKSIISSNHDLQKNKQQQQKPSKTMASVSPTPIGTQFALTMLGVHKNAPNSLQQHVSSTLGTLAQVQNSLSTPTTTNPNDKPQSQPNPSAVLSSPVQNRLIHKSATFENVSSSDTVEFAGNRTPFSPLLRSTQSNNGHRSSPVSSFELFFSSPAPANSNDLNSFLTSPTNLKSSSPFLTNNDVHTTSSSSPKSRLTSPSPSIQSSARSSTRLRQLLSNKSPPANDNPSQTLHYHPETKLDDFIQAPESPTTTHVSPSALEYSLSTSLPRPRQNSLSQNEQNNATDILTSILGRQSSYPSSPMRTDSMHSDDSSSSGMTSNKQRSDIYLRTLLNDEVRPQKVVVDTPFAVGARQMTQQDVNNDGAALLENNTKSQGTRLILKTGSSTTNDNKAKKKQRQNSANFTNQNNPMPRKPGRPKRSQTEYLLTTNNCQTPQSALSDGSLDALLDSSAELDQLQQQTSPISLRRTTRQTSIPNTTASLKRPLENTDDPLQNPKKYSKLLAQALKQDCKVECQDILLSNSIAHPKLLNQSSQMVIKNEPEQNDGNLQFDKPSQIVQSQVHPSTANNNAHSSPSFSHSTSLLRTLIRTSQTTSQVTKKDAPLYDLLENLDTPTATSNDISLASGSSSLNNTIDPLEQYLTPVLSQTPTSDTISSKDDYLTSLLSADPHKPNDISFVSINKQQTMNDYNRITALAMDLCNSATTTTQKNTGNPNDDFLSLLDNRDFLECLSESSTIDSILSQNSSSVIETTYPSAINKRSEKDEKAISEIYQTLLTAIHPNPSQNSLSNNDMFTVNSSSSTSITGDFLFVDNSNSIPPNRTVNQDAPHYCQPPVPPSSAFPYTSNTNQLPDCLSMDLLDNGGSFPPNVTLSPMNNSFTSQPTPHMNTNSMMMHAQPPDIHIQHRQASNAVYRQTVQHHPQQQQQQQQQPMYNNYGQSPVPHPPPPPQTQPTPNFYSMPPSSNQQPRMTPMNHNHQTTAAFAKRPAMIQQPQPQPQQRVPAQMNQQPLQFHMSMNFTLPPQINNQQQSLQQQPHKMHRPVMNTYNNLIMTNNNAPPQPPPQQQQQPQPSMPQDYHPYSNTSSLDLSYNPDMFVSQPTVMGQQSLQNRHMTHMQHSQPPLPPSDPHTTMHQPYSNMSVALSATIQQNTHSSNSHMNPPMSNLTPAECRQSEELNNQMMNCLSFQPVRSTSDFVRKQLQNTIQGRQKPNGGKDLSGTLSHSSLSANLDYQKGAYFRNQLTSQRSTPPLQTTVRPQQQDKTT